MSEKKVSVDLVVSSGGYGINANGIATVTFKLSYDELVNTVNLLQMLSNDIDIVAHVPGEKPKEIGKYFRIKQINVDGDGEQTVKFAGVSEFANVDAISSLPFKNAEVPQFKVNVTSVVEIEDDDDEDDDGWGDDDWSD